MILHLFHFFTEESMTSKTGKSPGGKFPVPEVSLWTLNFWG